MLVDQTCRNSHDRTALRDIGHDDRIGAHTGVITKSYATQHLRPRTDVDVPSDLRRAGSRLGCTQRHLLEYEAIGSDSHFGMDDDSVRMRQQQPAANLAAEGDLGPRYDAPHPVPNDGDSTYPWMPPASATP